MKFFTKSGGINLTEFTASVITALTAGTGISISSVTSSTGAATLTTYTISADLAVDEISDINITSIANKDILQYNSGTQQWENVDFTLATLSDVNLTSPADQSLLKYDTGTSKWIDGFTSLAKLSDATINTPLNHHSLQYNGTNWYNAFPRLVDDSDVILTNPIANDALIHNGSTWVNLPLASVSGGMLYINTTSDSNSSSAQEYLQAYSIDSDMAVNGNLFEIEAHITVTHTTDNIEEVAIKLDNSITLATATIESGDTSSIILKATLLALTGGTAHFTDEAKIIAGRGLEPTITSFFATTSFTLAADHTIKVWVDPGIFGAGGTISCDYFTVKYIK